MTTKLLAAASLGEALFGIFVFMAPEFSVYLLFRRHPAPDALIFARVAGIALLGLGVACYPAGSRQGLYGLLAYSLLVMLYLIVVGIGGAAGVLLWPAVAVHALLSALLIILARAAAARQN